MTKSQKCVLDQTSDVRQILDMIADKWTELVLMALWQGTKRYSELHRAIGGIS